MVYYVKQNEVKNGKIKGKHYSSTVIVRDFETLVEIPAWENLNWILIANCPLLETLPNWPTVRHLICINCPKITEFPAWKSLIAFAIAYNPNIERLPEFGKLDFLEIRSCPLITEVSFQECKTCRYEKTPALEYPALIVLLQTDFILNDLVLDIFKWLK